MHLFFEAFGANQLYHSFDSNFGRQNFNGYKKHQMTFHVILVNFVHFPIIFSLSLTKIEKRTREF